MSSLTSFLALASNPPAGTVIRVKVRGIGTGNTAEIRAYEIDARIKD